MAATCEQFNHSTFLAIRRWWQRQERKYRAIRLAGLKNAKHLLLTADIQFSGAFDANAELLVLAHRQIVLRGCASQTGMRCSDEEGEESALQQPPRTIEQIANLLHVNLHN